MWLCSQIANIDDDSSHKKYANKKLLFERTIDVAEQTKLDKVRYARMSWESAITSIHIYTHTNTCGCSLLTTFTHFKMNKYSSNHDMKNDDNGVTSAEKLVHFYRSLSEFHGIERHEGAVFNRHGCWSASNTSSGHHWQNIHEDEGDMLA